ncbi:hypothetical protein OSSY52_12120 [Tepiditoga spiralis]|uniref:Segregation and condensation protein B n=1 Tax=Tepiditoga spiralis TaxID=2108365 RepID=A0A7G1G410_9BACT|nr:SMC-Scp complex subunit ScpB [Tepiditoga spiralis]BBE31071.1 hypothetical protein OSSY52_12120 [Tepiditoga spiralis]
MKQQMIEALIYSRQNGISIEEIMKILSLNETEVIDLIHEIQYHYTKTEHGVELIRNNNKYRFEIKSEIKALITPKPKRIDLTGSQFEILAILYLNGPSRSGEIERSRGKNSYFQLNRLMDYGLIKRIRKDERKIYYYTLTEKFYNWIPEDTLKKLEELKNVQITKNFTNDGDSSEKSSTDNL